MVMKAADDHDRPNPSPEKDSKITAPSLSSSDDELKAIFEHCDEDKDGKISRDELMKFLQNLHLGIEEEQAVDMINSVDVNEDGHVDYEEFIELYRNELGLNIKGNSHDANGVKDEEDDEKVMKEAFDIFDVDHDGYITAKELQSVLKKMGMLQGRTLEECIAMIGRYDKDGNGSVDFHEFKEMMISGIN